MFELAIFAGMGATAVCFLKGHVRSGLVCVALAVAGFGAGIGHAMSTEGDMGEASTGKLLMVGIAVWAVVSVALALSRPKPLSYWERRRARAPDGSQLYVLQPRGARLMRMMLGAVLGLVPSIVFVASIMATLEGDESQLGFLVIYMAPLGFFGGGWIGYHWVPKTALPEPPRRKAAV